MLYLEEIWDVRLLKLSKIYGNSSSSGVTTTPVLTCVYLFHDHFHSVIVCYITENLAGYQVRREFIPSSFRYKFVWDPVKVHIGSTQVWTGCS